MSKPTAERLRELFHYDPQTGLFTWKVSQGSAMQGSVAGTINRNGYLNITVERSVCKAHRLAWLYMTGEWPADQMDHINGIRADNRWANLRVVSKTQNMWNSKKRHNNTSGYRGVSFDKRRSKWQAKINFDGDQYFLGHFKTPEDAAERYAHAAAVFFGEFARKD